jgi:hypothetical protein
MSEDDKHIYLEKHQQSAENRRRLAAEPSATSQQRTPCAKSAGSHWGNGSRNMSVAPSHVQAALAAGTKIPSLAEVFDFAEFGNLFVLSASSGWKCQVDV